MFIKKYVYMIAMAAIHVWFEFSVQGRQSLGRGVSPCPRLLLDPPLVSEDSKSQLVAIDLVHLSRNFYQMQLVYNFVVSQTNLLACPKWGELQWLINICVF